MFISYNLSSPPILNNFLTTLFASEYPALYAALKTASASDSTTTLGSNRNMNASTIVVMAPATNCKILLLSVFSESFFPVSLKVLPQNGQY